MRKFSFIFLFLIILSNSLYSQTQITERNIQNSVVFADAYGFARYYYPTKNTTQIEWEKIVTTGLTTVFECKNDDELIDSLQSFFFKISPEILFTKNDSIINDTINIKKKKYYYEHEGFGDGKITSSSKLMSFLIKLTQPYKSTIKHKKPITNKKYFQTTCDSITIHVPYGLDKKYKFNNIDNYNVPKFYQNIGAIIIAWNVYKHFYPYQENVESNWFKILETSMKMVSNDTNDYKTFEALKYLTHTLNDGHARVFYKKDSLHYQPPFTVKIIDSNLFINKIQLEFKGKIPTGVQIVRINNELPTKLIDSLRNFVSSSTLQWSNLRIEEELLGGSKNSTLNIVYKQADQFVENTVVRDGYNDNWTYFTGNPIKLLDDSIYYINIETLTYDVFKKNIAKFNTSKGIIIDYRGYPKSGASILKHFKDTILKSPYWKVPYKTLFSIDKDSYISRGPAVRWTIAPSKKIIKVPVVFLTDANAISSSETQLDMIKYYKLGTIIGQPTAGSNGNVTGFSIYHKFKCIFTGMKVINNDGELITKNGIEPDILVPVTEDGIKNSKDEILLYGIEYIKSQLKIENEN